NAPQAPLQNFFAFDAAFRGGVTVAAGDTNGDGVADIVVGAGRGGFPQVRSFSYFTGAIVADFPAYDPAFRGGVTVTAVPVSSHVSPRRWPPGTAAAPTTTGPPPPTGSATSRRSPATTSSSRPAPPGS